MTRREERREARRQAILDVAAQSFLERGYDGTTMSGIAATLGGSKGTLWSYFPSKDVLFAEVIDWATSEFRKQLLEILNPRDEMRDTLRRFCREFLRKVTSAEAVALYRLVMGEASRFPRIGEIFFERAPLQTQTLLARYLEEEMARGLLRRQDPFVAARQLMGACFYGTHQQLLMGAIDTVAPGAIEAEAEAATTFFLAAYAL